MLLSLLLACDPPSSIYLTDDVRLIAPDSLRFEDTPYGHVAGQSVLLENLGGNAASVTLSLSADPGFSVDRTELVLPAGGQSGLYVYYLSSGAEDATGILQLSDQRGGSLRIDLYGSTDDDADDDGYAHDALGGDDCDDDDAEVNPSAAEIWYDGLDSDCDGGSDYDADADGYDSDVYGGDDCDDADGDAHPSATELWYDGVDQDCAGGDDYDADADGFQSDAYGGLDCDDSSQLISPDDAEIWYDGLDSDCDGGSDYDADADGYDSDVYGGDDCDDADDGASPGSREGDDGDDDDCDGLVDEGFAASGDLVLTELMIDPSASSDAFGQYVEIWNASDRELNLRSWSLVYGSDSSKANADVWLSPGGYALWCATDRSEDNGGISCDLTWEGDLELTDAGALSLSLGTTEADGLDWSGWSLPTGASLSLGDDAMDAELNDDESVWCASSSSYGEGDLGTPGFENDACR